MSTENKEKKLRSKSDCDYEKSLKEKKIACSLTALDIYISIQRMPVHIIEIENFHYSKTIFINKVVFCIHITCVLFLTVISEYCCLI